MRFRQVAGFRNQDSDPKETFIYHNAGLAGMGGSSYIDSVILRDRDANTAWTAASDATLEERRYLVQNWRADVTTMLNTSGEPVEWYRYSAYGQPTSHPIADINGDGTVDSSDTAAWLDLQSGDSSGSVWLTDDLNRDDVFPGDTADDTFFYAQQTAASGLSSGYDRQSAYGLRKGYAGYEWDDTLAMWHVRHSVLDSKSGRLLFAINAAARPSVGPVAGPTLLPKPLPTSPYPKPSWWNCVQKSAYLGDCRACCLLDGSCHSLCENIHRARPEIPIRTPIMPGVGDPDPCRTACILAGSAGIAICVNGAPTVCDCTRITDLDPSSPKRGAWEAEVGKCVSGCEGKHFGTLTCDNPRNPFEPPHPNPPYFLPGPPAHDPKIPGEGRGCYLICSECRVQTCGSNCMESIDCRGDQGCTERKRSQRLQASSVCQLCQQCKF